MADNNVAAGLATIGKGLGQLKDTADDRIDLERKKEEAIIKKQNAEIQALRFETVKSSFGYDSIDNLSNEYDLYAEEDKSAGNEFLKLPENQEKITKIAGYLGKRPEEVEFMIKRKTGAFQSRKEFAIKQIEAASRILTNSNPELAKEAMTIRDFYLQASNKQELDAAIEDSEYFVKRVLGSVGGTQEFQALSGVDPVTKETSFYKFNKGTGEAEPINIQKGFSPQKSTVSGLVLPSAQVTEESKNLLGDQKTESQTDQQDLSVDVTLNDMKEVVNRQLTPNDLKTVQSARDDFTKENDQLKEAISAAEGLYAVIESDAQVNIPAVVGIRLNKILRNPGTLTEQEQKVFTKFGNLSNQLQQAILNGTTLRLTEDSRNQLREFISDLQAANIEAMNKSLISRANSVKSDTAGRVGVDEAVLRINEEFGKNALIMMREKRQVRRQFEDSEVSQLKKFVREGTPKDPKVRKAMDLLRRMGEL